MAVVDKWGTPAEFSHWGSGQPWGKVEVEGLDVSAFVQEWAQPLAVTESPILPLLVSYYGSSNGDLSRILASPVARSVSTVVVTDASDTQINAVANGAFCLPSVVAEREIGDAMVGAGRRLLASGQGATGFEWNWE
jgi:hypothetical protein